MVREDLVSSAITFLQDPSVAASPIEKRVAFLQSKNLTQDEIDTALARAGDDPSTYGTATPPTSNTSYNAYQQQQVMRQQPPGGYGGYQQGYWGQPPPPELPRRDWRDWFIMATVMGGVSYGLYFIAKRYIYPVIAPPTPPQLEQDKAAIDASFEKAFALLDQLSTDTSALKASEEARTERLDTALREVEEVISELKTASRRREDEGRRISEEVRALKGLIPKALEGQKDLTDGRMRELGSELRSLKTLIGNRVGGGSGSPAASVRNYGALGGERTNGTGSTTPREPTAQNLSGGSGSTASNGTSDSQTAPSSTSVSPSPVPNRESSNNFAAERASGGRAAIPAWQMAAATKNKSVPPENAGGSENGAGAETDSTP
ncbi:MAG: peroxisomal membrane protein pex14 [Pleopsidium flavum]|nr:MAG: peroxisomal membrane protein pex14 [Pleopsidium flavum]